MKKIDSIIWTLILSIFVLSLILIYKCISFSSYTITFVLNGADSISEKRASCSFSLRGCVITLPSIERKDGVAEGYSLDKSDTIARYKPGEKVVINSDMTLYGISYGERSLKIDASKVDYIEETEITCKSYNDTKTCKARLPLFNKIGYQNIGYSVEETKSTEGVNHVNAEYLPNEEYDIKESVTLIPRFENHSDEKYDVNYVGEIHGNFVESGKDVASETVEKFKKYLEEIYVKAPYLYTNIKINLLSEKEFNKIWKDGTVEGVTYIDLLTRPSKFGTIDIKSNRDSRDEEDNYHVIVHEMAHAWDSYFPFKINDIYPKEISSKVEKLNFTSYKKSKLSKQAEITDLYKKYYDGSYESKDWNNWEGVLSGYSNTNEGEFFAEMIALYYLKYIVPTGKFVNVNYPDDVKKVAEKYICIAKNNYHTSKCV